MSGYARVCFVLCLLLWIGTMLTVTNWHPLYAGIASAVGSAIGAAILYFVLLLVKSAVIWIGKGFQEKPF